MLHTAALTTKVLVCLDLSEHCKLVKPVCRTACIHLEISRQYGKQGMFVQTQRGADLHDSLQYSSLYLPNV